MKPCLRQDLPYEVYDKEEGVRSAWLQRLKRSPRHLFSYIRETSRMPSKALILGRAIHCAVLEPNRFTTDFVAAPDVDRRTVTGRKTWEEFKERVGNAEVLTTEEFDQCVNISWAIKANAAAAQLIDPGNTEEVELSLFWNDHDTKLDCKGRLDCFKACPHKGILIDLKSCRDATRFTFERECWRYGYARQLAWYRRGLKTLELPVTHCLIVAVEKDPPHGVMVYRIKDEVLDYLDVENTDLLRTYAYCKENDDWPSYPGVVEDIGLPDWALRGGKDEVTQAEYGVEEQ